MAPVWIKPWAFMTSVQVTHVGCAALAALERLRELDLRNQAGVDTQVLETLASSPVASSLTSLRLSNCLAICPEGVQAVSGLTNLENLELAYTGSASNSSMPLPAGARPPPPQPLPLLGTGKWEARQPRRWPFHAGWGCLLRLPPL